MSYNEKSKENLNYPIDNSSEEINQKKSDGKIKSSINKNLLLTLRSRITEWDLIDKVVAGVNEEVEEGNYKNAIKLIDIAKENEKQDINLTASKGVTIEVASEKDKEIIEGI